MIYVIRTRPSGEGSLRLLSLAQGNDRELMRAMTGESLSVLDRLPDSNALLAIRRTSKGSEVWRLSFDGSEPATLVVTTSENLPTFRVLGAKDATTLYLGKPKADVLEVWRLSTNGTLVPLPAVTERIPAIQIGRVELSADRRRFAFFTEYRPPAVPLEVKFFDNLFRPATILK